jgi:C1A family cysteine protease
MNAFACAKQSAVPKNTGYVPDDPARVSAIPLIVSTEYLQSGSREIQDPTVAASFTTAPKAPRGGGSGGKQDTTAPTVSFLSPINGSTVSGLVSVQIKASDRVGVTSVSLSADGVLVGTTATTPYTIPWSAPADGLNHSLVATAKDAAGNSSSTSTTVKTATTTPTTNPTTTPVSGAPTVQITSPANGATVQGVVNIAVSASDDVQVASVSISIDGANLEPDYVAPYEIRWDTQSLVNGTHRITATAKDSSGLSSAHTIVVTKADPITVLPPGSTYPASHLILMPPVRNQGGEGSCGVFSTTYAARSAEYFHSTNATLYSDATNIFSPEFVYNQTKVSDCGSGTGVTSALDFMMDKGVATWQSMPYDYSNGCNLMPTASQLTEASKYRITTYSKMVNSDQAAIKGMLYRNHPVIITINPDQAFWDAKSGFVWRSYTGAPGISHSIVISGYDDAKHAYQVMNSWGTEWGDAGFTWIDYDFFPLTSFYFVYVITN